MHNKPLLIPVPKVVLSLYIIGPNLFDIQNEAICIFVSYVELLSAFFNIHTGWAVAHPVPYSAHPLSPFGPPSRSFFVIHIKHIMMIINDQYLTLKNGSPMKAWKHFHKKSAHSFCVVTTQYDSGEMCFHIQYTILRLKNGHQRTITQRQVAYPLEWGSNGQVRPKAISGKLPGC